MRRIAALLSLATATLLPAAFAADAEPGNAKRLTSGERKEALKTLVETKPNGDVLIRRNPAADFGRKSKAPKLPDAVTEMMLHIYPDMDFEKFSQKIERNAHRSGDVRIKETMHGCDDYLSEIGFSIKRIKFAPGTMRGRINSGIPFFIALYNKDGWDEKIYERTKRRPADTKDWDEWKQTLRKDTIKEKDVVGKLFWCLIWGHNKASGEFFVEINGRGIWMSEAEIKLLQHSFYEIR